MQTIPLNVVSPSDNHPLMFGIPFAADTFTCTDHLSLMLKNDELPVWYNVRNTWKDGSIRWVFLHSRIPRGRHVLHLSIVKGSKPEKQSVVLNGNSVQLEHCCFTVEEDRFSLRCPNGSVSYSGDEILSDLGAARFSPAEWDLSLVEASPIAPLVRIREEETGFSRDFLIRLDPAGERMTIHRRMTAFREGFFYLNGASGLFTFSSPVGGGRTAVLSPGTYRVNGEDVQGYPAGTFRGEEAGIHIDKFWQRYPAAVECRGHAVMVEFYPGEAEPLPVSGGMSYRHAVSVACSSAGLDGLGADVETVIDRRQMVESLACEKIYVPKGDFLAFEEINSRILYHTKHDLHRDGRYAAEIDQEEKQHPDFFGLEHYGDFPAPVLERKSTDRPAFYWDNEYDTAFGYYRGYAMYGDVRALQAAYWHAAHMSDMDISSVSGDMKYHGSGHHHTAFTSEMGHVWNDGCWLNYFFFGDIWAKEAGEKLCLKIMSEMCSSRDQLINGYCFAERYTGWPLMVLVAGYEALGNAEMLAGARFLVDFMIDFLNDPYFFYENEFYYEGEPSEFYRSALMDGCKPFMLGVIMEAMERYFVNTGDRRIIASLQKTCDFITDRLWDANRGAFMYEWNAYDKSHFEEYNQFLSCLFIRGLAFTYSQTGIRKYRDVATIAFRASLAVLETGEGSGGKNFAQLSRSLGGFVAYLDEWRREDEQRYIETCSRSTEGEFFWGGSIPELMQSGKVVLRKGSPLYDGEALVGSVTSYIDGTFAHPSSGDRGEVSLYVCPEENILPHARVPSINFKSCFHVSSDTFNRSGLSILSLYSRTLIVKVYDQYARQINLASAPIRPEGVSGEANDAQTADPVPNWLFGEWHHILVRWQAPGDLSVVLDGREMDRICLNRPLGGEVSRLCLAYRPGNWRFYGKLKLDYLRLGT